MAAAALIVAAGGWAYSNSVEGVFVLDDVRAIVQNETIRDLSTALSPPPRSTVSGRPVANLSFALSYAVSGPDPWGYHLMNVVIHVAAALVLFGVIGRTLRRAQVPERLRHAADGIAAAAALLWVVHPLTTSAVTYIVQRAESLMSLFYLLTLYCAIRAEGSRRQGVWMAASIASCALGMGTKEVMVTAPLAVALWDGVFRRGEPIRWRLWAGLAATWTIFAILVSGESRGASMALSAEMSWRYLLTQAEVVTRYLRLAFVPAPLIFLYTWPLVTSIGDVLPEALLIVLLLGATFAGVLRRHPLGYAGAFFFLVLAPTSSVVPIVTEVAAEHRMYLPLAALIAAVVGGAYSIVGSRLALARAAGALTVGVAVVLGLQTRARNHDYASAERLWGDTVANDPANQRARVAYGTVLAIARRPAEAEEQFRAAVRLNESDPIARGRLGTILMAQQKPDAALPHLEAAIALNPGDVDAHRALGQIYGLRRDDSRAVMHLARALEAQPNDVMLLLRVAALRADSRDPVVRNPAEARKFAERAVGLTRRRNAYALDVLAVAQAADGRFSDAAATAREGLEVARAEGNAALISELEGRARAYAARAEGRRP